MAYLERLQGSVTQKINLGTLRELPVPTPALEEQRAIAHILGTLDDKIELNRRMNETLEAMARALFKSWFVDFDPVRAKAEGRDPGLPKPLADLFPDSFEDSELGEIPKGWEVGSLLATLRTCRVGGDDAEYQASRNTGTTGPTHGRRRRLVAGIGTRAARARNVRITDAGHDRRSNRYRCQVTGHTRSFLSSTSLTR